MFDFVRNHSRLVLAGLALTAAGVALVVRDPLRQARAAGPG